MDKNLITRTNEDKGVEIVSFNSSLFDEFVRFVDGSERTTFNYLQNLKHFAVWMRYRGINFPTRDDILEYRDWLLSEHCAIEYADTQTGWQVRTDKDGKPVMVTCKPSTVKLYMQSVRQFFKWTGATGKYPDVSAQIHAPKVRTDIHKKDALAPTEVLTIEKTITEKSAEKTEEQAQKSKDTQGRVQRSVEQGKRLYAMYQLAVNAGLRTIELSRANIKDIEKKGEQAFIYIWGKGHSEPDQKKPIAIEVYNAIQDYIASRKDNVTPSSPLFVSTGNRSNGKRIDPVTISKMLKKAMIQAGFDSERLTAHSLRHTAGTTVQALTGDLYATQTYMRHANPATTEIYLHNDTERKDASIAERLYRTYHKEGNQGSTATPTSSISTELMSNPSANELVSILEDMTVDQVEILLTLARKLV